MVSAKEIHFSVPWGQISGKSYGSEDDELVLLFHGMADNAGSFDTLIPHLPTHLNYVCIDLPGHGKSTFLPEFFPPYTQDFVFVIKLIVDFFKKGRYTFIGHSYGGQLLFLFSVIYPEHVKKMVLLDAIFPAPVDPKDFSKYMRSTFDLIKKVYENRKSGTVRTYTYEEAADRMINGRKAGFLKKEVADNLLKRALIPWNESGTNNGDYKFQFSIDPRLTSRAFNIPYDVNYFAKVLECNPIRCPILVLHMKSDEKHPLNPIHEQIPIITKFKNIKIVDINGGHTYHANHPLGVSHIITAFLLSENKNSELESKL